MILDQKFYLNNDVVFVAKQLIGKVLYTRIGNNVSAGIIIETEAYAGVDDKASHAYNNKLTPRTEIMYKEGGYAYIYLIYGMHSLFNVVTNKSGIPHAILVRSIFPIQGFNYMESRIGKKLNKFKNGIGPGRLSKLLGINYKMTGMPLVDNQNGDAIWIENQNIIIPKRKIQIGKRIGVEYAKEDADRLYRFWIDASEIDLSEKTTKPVDEGNSFF